MPLLGAFFMAPLRVGINTPIMRLTHFSLLLAAVLAGCASAPRVDPVEQGQTDPMIAGLPASIRIPARQVIATRALFEGGLIYTCVNQSAKGMPPIFDWEETGSQGALTFEGEQGYGQHEGQSYTWRLGRTTLQGAVVRTWQGNDRSDAPWGLYKTIGAAGSNLLTQVNWIQRIETQGGAIPTVACNEKFLGTRHAMKASAYFVFWKDATP